MKKFTVKKKKRNSSIAVTSKNKSARTTTITTTPLQTESNINKKMRNNKLDFIRCNPMLLLIRVSHAASQKPPLTTRARPTYYNISVAHSGTTCEQVQHRTSNRCQPAHAPRHQSEGTHRPINTATSCSAIRPPRTIWRICATMRQKVIRYVRHLHRKTYFTFVSRDVPKSTARRRIKYPAVISSFRLLPSGMLITRSTLLCFKYIDTEVASTGPVSESNGAGFERAKTSRPCCW